MKQYRTIDEVIADRRLGVGLNWVLESLLGGPPIWEPYGPTPFSIIPQLNDGDFVDMVRASWARIISTRNQLDLAHEYQLWYASKLGLSEPEIKLEELESQFGLFRDSDVTLMLIPPMDYLTGQNRDLVKIRKPFWLGKTEVSQNFWTNVMHEAPDYHITSSNLPVVNLRFGKLKKFLQITNLRLPTDGEWEMACRSGTTTHYNFGSYAMEYFSEFWNVENSGGEIRAVGSLKPNAFGLYNMHGNVWEICKFKTQNFSLRGGSAFEFPYACTSRYREIVKPSEIKRHDIGFRVAKSYT